MTRRLRDIGVTLFVLVVLFGTLTAINPRMREQVEQFSGGVQSQNWDPAGSPVGHATMTFVDVISEFAADNPIMFAFAIIATVLFMMMLKVL